MKKIVSIMLAMLILVLGIAPAFAVDYKNVKEGQTLYVKTSGGDLNLRETPSRKTNVLMKLPYATPVTATREYENGYLHVYYSVGSERTMGWVDIKYLSDKQPSKSEETPKETVASLSFKSYKLVPEGTTYVVSAKPSRNGGFVNLRWVPSTDSAIIERMYRGEEMKVIAEGQKWLQVQCKDGYVGFIFKNYTDVVFQGDTAEWEAMQAAQE